jgi:hypothetical protein
MSKIYISGGAINIEGVSTETVIINPVHFDWEKKVNNYFARDGLQNQSYDLGLLGSIENENGVAYPDLSTLLSTLNSFVNNAGSNSVDVNIQDQTTPPIEHFMYQELADVVIAGTLIKGTNVITLEAGHGFAAPVAPNKDYLNIHYVDTSIPALVGVRFSQHAVVGVAGNDISITPPIAYDLNPVNVETSKRVNVNMAIAGGTHLSPIRFETRPPNGLKWDLTRFIGDMILTSLADDGLFGNIAALTNGVYFGFEGDNFTDYQLAIFDNGGWRASAYDVEATVRSGGSGDFGLAIRKTSAGQDKLGVAIRLDGELNDKFIKSLQDDLSSLVRYRIKIMGHVVED